jgi:type IV pilus assembly protein PilY1
MMKTLLKTLAALAFLYGLLLSPLVAAAEAKPLPIQLSGSIEHIRAVSLDSQCGQHASSDAADRSTANNHGIRLVHAHTDRLIWQLETMAFAVCADITVVDSNEDGYIDRLYFANTGGQLWRVQLDSDNSDLWRAQLLLELEEGQPFFTAPDVVVSQDAGYYGIIIGSAGTAQTHLQSTQNYLIFYRDYCLHSAAADCTAGTKTLADLQQLIHPNRAQPPVDNSKYHNGWYLPLAADEVTVTRAATQNYTTVVATFNPGAAGTCTYGDCTTTGESRLYYFNPFYFDSDPNLEHRPYYRLVEGAGPLPDPQPFIQLPEPKPCRKQSCKPLQPIIAGFNFGDTQQQIEQPELGLIVKSWWHNHRDD